jgi:Flp pilus assembly pilin Flp
MGSSRVHNLCPPRKRWRTGIVEKANLGLREEGQSVVEYAMVMVVVAITLAAGFFVTPLGTAIGGAIDVVTNALSGTSS